MGRARHPPLLPNLPISHHHRLVVYRIVGPDDGGLPDAEGQEGEAHGESAEGDGRPPGEAGRRVDHLESARGKLDGLHGPCFKTFIHQVNSRREMITNARDP